MVDIDRRVLTLALARASGAMANSFLILLLPVYIGSTAISLSGISGVEVAGISLGNEFYIGLVLSAFGLISSIVQPFVGGASDRLRRRKVFILVGIFVVFLSTVLYPFVDNYAYVLVLRGIQGLGAGLIVPTTVALVNAYSENSDGRGESFGVYNTFRLLGFGLGPIIAGATYSNGPYNSPLGIVSGINATFTVAALGSLLSLILVIFLVEEMVPEETINSMGGGEDKSEGSSILPVPLSDPAGISRVNPVIVLGIGTFILAATITMYASLEDPVNNRLNQGSFLFGAQFSAGVLANVLFQIPAGRLSDKIGRKPLIVAGFAILIPSLLAQAYILSSAIMLLARVVVGVSVAFVFPTSLALAGDITAGEKSGATLSILTAAFSLGVAFGPVTSGLLYSTGSFQTPFLVSTAGAVIGLIVTIFAVYEPSKSST